jgi:hypothetical protein
MLMQTGGRRCVQRRVAICSPQSRSFIFAELPRAAADHLPSPDGDDPLLDARRRDRLQRLGLARFSATG